MQNLTGTLGTIKSPNYPAPYPHYADYRWNINTEPNSRIRLLFALFETQEGSDFIHVRRRLFFQRTILYWDFVVTFFMIYFFAVMFIGVWRAYDELFIASPEIGIRIHTVYSEFNYKSNARKIYIRRRHQFTRIYGSIFNLLNCIE